MPLLLWVRPGFGEISEGFKARHGNCTSLNETPERARRIAGTEEEGG